MAKISFYGSWIDLKSLNEEDRRNYKISMFFFFLGALCWGIHLSGTDVGFLAAENINNTSLSYTIARFAVIIFWFLAIIFYLKFYRKQDELLKRWHDYVLSWGAISFILLGMIISLFSPYIEFSPSFYEYFLAFAVGTVIGGFRFHKNYLS